MQEQETKIQLLNYWEHQYLKKTSYYYYLYLDKSIGEIKGIIMKKYFEKKFGEGTAFDLDYGKLLILALLIYIAFFK